MTEHAETVALKVWLVFRTSYRYGESIDSVWATERDADRHVGWLHDRGVETLVEPYEVQRIKEEAQ